MPKLPDITVCVERLAAKLVGHVLRRVRIGKRVMLALEGELFVAIRLLIAGRLRRLADCAFSRLLKASWPRKIDELS
jgi:hypothetical protein